MKRTRKGDTKKGVMLKLMPKEEKKKAMLPSLPFLLL